MFGERIKKLRRENSMTQKDLANLLGVSASAIGMYEQNRREPSGEMLVNICSIFKISLDYLVSGHEHELKQASSYKNKDSSASPSDLSSIIDELKEQLKTQDTLLFRGEVLSKDDIEIIFNAMKIGAGIAFNQNRTD